MFHDFFFTFYRISSSLSTTLVWYSMKNEDFLLTRFRKYSSTIAILYPLAKIEEDVCIKVLFTDRCRWQNFRLGLLRFVNNCSLSARCKRLRQKFCHLQWWVNSTLENKKFCANIFHKKIGFHARIEITVTRIFICWILGLKRQLATTQIKLCMR